MEAQSGKRFEVINPATGEVVCDAAEGDAVSFYHLLIGKIFKKWLLFKRESVQTTSSANLCTMPYKVRLLN